MPALTLLVPLQDPGRALDALVAALDGQTAPVSTFEVVLVDAGSTDGSRARVERLAQSRPHLSLVGVARDAGLPDQVTAGLGVAQGELVALLPAGSRPTLDAVELLTATGNADRAVVGRRGSDGEGDGFPLEDGEVGALPGPGGLLAVPAATLRDAGDGAATLLTDGVPGDVVAVGTRACLAGAFRAPAGRLEDAACAWADDGLDLHAAVGAPAAGLEVWLVLARADGLQERVLPATVEDGPSDHGLARLSATLPLAAVPGDGLWSVRLRVRGAGQDRTYPLVCPSPGPAVVDGRLVAALVDPGGLVLDLGATTRGVVGRVAAADATVDRTARGSLLVLPCPQLHVHGDADVPAAVLLGRFRLPAVLVCRAGAAHVESWVSGLAGRSRIAVQVGGPRARRTGLDLVVDDTGRMSLARTPRKRAEPTPRPAPSDADGGRLRQVRDHLPAAVLPGARRLARTAVGQRVRALVARL